MNQFTIISLQFFPHLVGFLALLFTTWILARFTKFLFLWATVASHAQSGKRQKVSEIFATASAWIIWVLMLPFILDAAGIHFQFLQAFQHLEAQFFVNWPIWMGLSLVFAIFAYLFREVPKFYFQLRASLVQKKIQG